MPVIKIKQLGKSYAAGEVHFPVPADVDPACCPPLRLGDVLDIPNKVWTAAGSAERAACEQTDERPNRPFVYANSAQATFSHWKYRRTGLKLEDVEQQQAHVAMTLTENMAAREAAVADAEARRPEEALAALGKKRA